MRKLLSCILVVIMLLSLTACASKVDKVQEEPAPSEAQPAVDATNGEPSALEKINAVNAALNGGKTPEVSPAVPADVPKETADISNMYGKWASETGTLFEFTADGKYGYYKDKNDTSDNYYKGSFEILKGKAAMDALYITDEEFDRSLKKNVGVHDNVISAKLHMEVLHSEGIDKSDMLDKTNFYHFVFYISATNPNEAVVVNVADPNPFKVTKME